MKRLLSTTLSLFLLFGGKGQTLDYPLAKKDPTNFDYHGVHIQDPYVWMEKVAMEDVQSWMKQQDELLKSYVRAEEKWEKIHQTIHRMGNTGDNYSAPFKSGDLYLFQKTQPDLQQASIYAKKGEGGEPYRVLDPNEFYPDKNDVLSTYAFSPDGKYAAFFERKGQVGWGNLRIFDLEHSQLLDDLIPGIQTNQAIWTKDSKGFIILLMEVLQTC